jgi:nitrogen regulatory protein P-II 2
VKGLWVAVFVKKRPATFRNLKLGGTEPRQANGIEKEMSATMKLITAYIQPEKLNDVKQALYAAEVYKISVTNALGCGQQKGYHETYRGVDIEVNLLKKIRLEIAVNEDFVQPTIDAVVKGARTGNIGDGKIFITALERCVRIRTGEEGKDAIG